MSAHLSPGADRLPVEDLRRPAVPGPQPVGDLLRRQRQPSLVGVVGHVGPPVMGSRPARATNASLASPWCRVRAPRPPPPATHESGSGPIGGDVESARVGSTLPTLAVRDESPRWSWGDGWETSLRRVSRPTPSQASRPRPTNGPRKWSRLGFRDPMVPGSTTYRQRSRCSRWDTSTNHGEAAHLDEASATTPASTARSGGRAIRWGSQDG